MKRYRIVILLGGLIITGVVSAHSFLYNKSVQTINLANDFQEALNNSSYDDARLIKDKAGRDIFISKLFSFNEKANDLSNDQYEALKNSYLADTISYSEFNSKEVELEKLNFFNEDKTKREAIDKIEEVREVYRSAEASMAKKDYKAASENVNKIEDSIDEVYKNKLNNLKTQISDLALKDTETQLNEYLSKGDFDNAIKFLEGKKNLVSNDYIVENTNKINSLIKKRNDEEELKRKKAEEAKKREAELVASYLKGYIPNPEKETAVSAISSRTNFLVWVNLTSQETNIFVGAKGTWKLIHSFSSSTGKKGDETPTGTFTIKERGTWFFSNKYQEGAKYWVRFTGEYLFHSLPMNIDKQVVDSTLGTPASHGCVRLAIDNAAWLYNNVPTGTTVYIKN